LADTLSRLVELDPDYLPTPERPGEEFGFPIFQEEEPLNISAVQTRSQSQVTPHSSLTPLDQDDDANKLIKNKKSPVPSSPDTDNAWDEILPPISLDYSTVKTLQECDEFCKKLSAPTKGASSSDAPLSRNGYIFKDDLWYKIKRTITGDKELLVIPKKMQKDLAREIHKAGHAGMNKCLAYAQQNVWWKDMQNTFRAVIAVCLPCLQQNKKPTYVPDTHFHVPSMPMDFICLDLVGEFERTAKGNLYALTAIDMFTSFVWAIPIPDKSAETIVEALITHIMPFGAPRKILTDNGTEFKNELFREVTKALGVELVLTTPAYHPQSNGKLENFHYFLKSCTAKYCCKNLGWDQAMSLATYVYNFLPHAASKESPFFLMFCKRHAFPTSTTVATKTALLGRLKWPTLFACSTWHLLVNA
jgi:transposase InsO family protein